MKNKEKVISTQEERLKTEKNAFLKEKQEFESGHEQALSNLKSIYRKQYSLWKNIISFGKHNQKVNENYNIK
ncbi:mobilization protein, partial [Campylobacter jejuni]|nr:mobilization protein [Campylobacter jejuni]